MPLTETAFRLPGQVSEYHGKVRDAYTLSDGRIVMVATDRISAFDVILPRGIPCKGQILNQIAAYFLDATADIIPNWKQAVPDPMATVGLLARPLKLEVIVRGYLAGSAWREYAAGARSICGVPLPEGLRENQQLPPPQKNPPPKAHHGHHHNQSPHQNNPPRHPPPQHRQQIEQVALALFARGQKMATRRGLILVDTKYEFGLVDGRLILIDEIHTPDSSRYFYADGYQERLEKGEPQRQLSKEFVRQWLLDHGFCGKPGQQVPEMTPEYCRSVADRYIELYEHVTGLEFVPAPDQDDAAARIEKNLTDYLEQK